MRFRHGSRHFSRAVAVLGATICAVLGGAGAASAAAAPGSAVSSFGVHGEALLPAGTRLFGTAIQSNGDIVAVGESGTGSTANLLVARFLPTGTLDPSFGTGGIAAGPAVSGAKGSVGRSVAITPAGQIVVAGAATDATGGYPNGLLVERFNSGGTLDHSFGSSGVVDLLGTDFAQAFAVALQPNGDIVAAGSSDVASIPNFTLVRLTASGSLDDSFANKGIDVLSIGSYAQANAVAIQPNGSIVAAGSVAPNGQSTNSIIVRVTSNGALDRSFNGTGVLENEYNPGGAVSSINGLALQSNGDIIAAGGATGTPGTADAFVVRYTPSGTQDPTFGKNGVAYAQSATSLFGGNAPGGAAVALAANGDAIVAGQFDQGVTSFATVWAFTSKGPLDTSFGSKGASVLAGTGGGSTEFSGVTLAPGTGDVVAVGDAGGNAAPYQGLAAEFTGFGTSNGNKPPVTTPLKLSVSHIKASYKSAELKVTVACNQPCKLAIALGGGSGLARQLKLSQLVKKCQKYHGHERCHKVEEYRAVTVASAATTFGRARSQTFTLRLGRTAARGLHKVRSATMTLSVAASASSSSKSVKFSKRVTFRR